MVRRLSELSDAPRDAFVPGGQNWIQQGARATARYATSFREQGRLCLHESTRELTDDGWACLLSSGLVRGLLTRCVARSAFVEDITGGCAC